MEHLKVNGIEYEINADPNMPLLWVIRDILGLTGTKFGCGATQCGACTIHLNGEAVRSCITKLSRAAGQEVVTIEGLSINSDHLAPLKNYKMFQVANFHCYFVGDLSCLATRRLQNR